MNGPVDVSKLSLWDWADLDAAQQDPDHDSRIQIDGPRSRGTCLCGWLGKWQTGPGANYHALADADDHYNEEASPSWADEVEATLGEDDDDHDA